MDMKQEGCTNFLGLKPFYSHFMSSDLVDEGLDF